MWRSLTYTKKIVSVQGERAPWIFRAGTPAMEYLFLMPVLYHSGSATAAKSCPSADTAGISQSALHTSFPNRKRKRLKKGKMKTKWKIKHVWKEKDVKKLRFYRIETKVSSVPNVVINICLEIRSNINIGKLVNVREQTEFAVTCIQ